MTTDTIIMEVKTTLGRLEERIGGFATKMEELSNTVTKLAGYDYKIAGLEKEITGLDSRISVIEDDHKAELSGYKSLVATSVKWIMAIAVAGYLGFSSRMIWDSARNPPVDINHILEVIQKLEKKI